MSKIEAQSAEMLAFFDNTTNIYSFKKLLSFALMSKPDLFVEVFRPSPALRRPHAEEDVVGDALVEALHLDAAGRPHRRKSEFARIFDTNSLCKM